MQPRPRLTRLLPPRSHGKPSTRGDARGLERGAARARLGRGPHQGTLRERARLRAGRLLHERREACIAQPRALRGRVWLHDRAPGG
eukprot:7383621-Prymnesium_polylepis.1